MPLKKAGSRKRPIKGRTARLNILIADDHEIVRLGLRTLLKGLPRLRICGEASIDAEALEKVEKVEKLQPDIVLLKLDLPNKGALQMIPALLRLRPGLRILIFAEYGPTRDAQRAGLTTTVARAALEKGAMGLVLNPDARDMLLALGALSKNKSFVSSNIFEGVTSELTYRTDHLPFLLSLTGREAEIFGLIATGRTNKDIAADLGISPRTVEVHRASVMHKLGFR
ncbi:MAG TPA: response regulator transcription factor [Bryobacteraceae bacterium]|nr:response regulator transcription factor [Bryobacteraceae bacterium]